MENYIVINGKKAELTPEQLKALGIEVKEKSPFDRVKDGESFYYIECYGKVRETEERDIEAFVNDGMFNTANYCTDKALMEQRALHETLNRLLWRYSMEHEGDKIDWNNREQRKYAISYDYNAKSFICSWNAITENYGTVYFNTLKIAYNAIKEIVKPFMAEHSEFKW